jgi:predicted secreted Zn-dependent protease
MSRKDYGLIAEAIKARMDCTTQRAIVRDIANSIADKLQADNPNFDRAKFLKACGLD